MREPQCVSLRTEEKNMRKNRGGYVSEERGDGRTGGRVPVSRIIGVSNNQ